MQEVGLENKFGPPDYLIFRDTAVFFLGTFGTAYRFYRHDAESIVEGVIDRRNPDHCFKYLRAPSCPASRVHSGPRSENHDHFTHATLGRPSTQIGTLHSLPHPPVTILSSLSGSPCGRFPGPFALSKISIVSPAVRLSKQV